MHNQTMLSVQMSYKKTYAIMWIHTIIAYFKKSLVPQQETPLTSNNSYFLIIKTFFSCRGIPII